MKILLLIISAAVTASAGAAAPAWIGAAAGQDALTVDHRMSPFTEVLFEGDAMHVRIGDAWYALEAANGVAYEDLRDRAAAKAQDDENEMQRRLSEDLFILMAELGKPPSRNRVHLSVRNLETAERTTLLNAPATRENYNAIVEANRARKIDSVPRIEREHATEIDPQYAFLTTRINEGLVHGSTMLTRRMVEQDLDELEWRLRDQLSYLRLRDIDIEAAFDAVRLGAADELRLDDFAIAVQKLLSLFGDGHARVEHIEWYRPRGWAGCLFEDAGGRIVAVREDRSDFIEPAHPYVRAINGVGIERWIEQAAEMQPDGSPQWRRRLAVRDLRWFVHLCRELDVRLADITLALENEDRSSTTDVLYEVSEQEPVFGGWPRKDHALLRGDIGYLRIESMDDALIEDVVRNLHSLRDTRGLIIDVRGNGGGSRGVLRAILPYFMPQGRDEMVINIARYRLSESFAEDHLESRYLFPADHASFDEAERAAIVEARAAFAPQRPGAHQGDDEAATAAQRFSEWHYFVISRDDGHGEVFAYSAPVVVLMDAGCFSATDVFLGAFAMLENVTLLGQASGGGSGKVESFTLTHSGLEVAVSSMASYRPDGRLYDGRGVEVDITVEPSAAFFLGPGEPEDDPQLEAAVRMLSGRGAGVGE